MAQRKDKKGRNLYKGESQRADGRYMYRITHKEETYCVYAMELSELREKEKEIQQNIDNGISNSAGKITFNDLFNKYLSLRALKPTTKNNYIYMYETYVKNVLGTKQIKNILHSDISIFYNSLVNDKGLKIGTVSIIHSIIHPVFKRAVKDRIIPDNPTDEALSEIKNAHGNDATTRHALTVDEQSAFIDYVKTTPRFKRWMPLFTVLLGTGCRISEILGLRWQDCDFENNIISINHSLVYKTNDEGRCVFSITTPKTKAGCREIPMLQEVRKALLIEKQKLFSRGIKQMNVCGYTDFIFYNECGRLYYIQNVNQTIKTIVTDYNESERKNAEKEKRQPLIIKPFSAHTFRHTFCTRFCENETNVKAIQAIMGHSTISITMDIYAEATADKKKETISNLEGKIKIS